ncbi:hypothetical protein QQF64_023659 [Cirrhinus molitorella]|uniref:Uncharacterized protein n=1 Tax=Cirrhinus molitorella TaxID=172907 RepID=A0ABR3NJ23_9TELE
MDHWTNTQVQTWHAGTFSDRDDESVAVRSLTPFSPPYEEKRASMIDANEEQAQIDDEDEGADRDVPRGASDRHKVGGDATLIMLNYLQNKSKKFYRAMMADDAVEIEASVVMNRRGGGGQRRNKLCLAICLAHFLDPQLPENELESCAAVIRQPSAAGFTSQDPTGGTKLQDAATNRINAHRPDALIAAKIYRTKQASGYPPGIVTYEDKEKYIREYYEKEGIRLDPKKINNPAQRDGNWMPPLGDHLGELTDEIGDNDYIIEYGSSAPKSYGFLTAIGKVCMKAKGITLNAKNSQAIRLDTLIGLVTNYVKSRDDTRHILAHSENIVRNKKHLTLHNTSVDKKLRMVYNKC